MYIYIYVNNNNNNHENSNNNIYYNRTLHYIISDYRVCYYIILYDSKHYTKIYSNIP